MASPTRHPNHSVIARLSQKPKSFHFFQALRLIEDLWEQDRWPGFGFDWLRHKEPLILRIDPSLSFQASELISYEPRSEDKPAELTVSFTGLFGSMGALPQHYTSLILQRIRQKDETLREFLDLFHHRFLSLKYRAWAKHQLETSSRPREPQSQSRVILASIAGFGMKSVTQACRFDPNLGAEFATSFSQKPPTASGLKQILQSYFRWEIEVESWAGHWLYLEPENQARFVESDPTQPSAMRLGQDVILGRRIWDIQSRVCIRVGPLNYSDFLSMLPGGSAQHIFGQVARLYTGMEYDLEIVLLLRSEEIPQLELTSDENTGPCLGRNCWVLSQNLSMPSDDARFSVQET